MSEEFDSSASGGLTISKVGDLIAGLPAMLGFVPYRSLIVVSLDRRSQSASHQVGMVCRLDLPRTGDRSDAEAAAHLARLCADSNAVAALAFVIDEHLSELSGMASVHDRFRSLHVALEQRLAKSEIELIGTWCVPEVTAGGLWWNLVHPRHSGTVPDPTASPVAVQAVLHESAIYRDRDELVDTIAIDTALRDQVAQLLPEAAAEAHQRFVRALRIENPDAYTRMALWRVMAMLKRADDRSFLPPRDLAEAAVALRDSKVRDALFGVAKGTYSDVAERLWTILTRALSGPERAEAATMLAFHAYLRGAGPLAGVALDAALDADPEHRMAGILDYGLRMALHPDKLQRLVRCGVDIATDLGVDIGAARPDPAVGR